MTDSPASNMPQSGASEDATPPGCVGGLGASWQIRVKRVRALAPATMAAALLVPIALVFDLTSPGRDVITALFESPSLWLLLTGGDLGDSLIDKLASSPFLFLTLSLPLCSFVVWVTARLAVVEAFGGDHEDWPKASGPTCWTNLRNQYDLYWYLWMPRLLAAVPFAIIVVPLFIAPEVSKVLPLAISALVVVLMIILVLRRKRLQRDHPDYVYDMPRAVRTLGRIAAIGFISIFLEMIAPMDLLRAVGSPAIGLLAISFVIAMLASLYQFVKFNAETAKSRQRDGEMVPSGKVRYLPLVLLLFVVLVVASFWNDNHVINGRHNAISGPVADRQSLKDAETAWLRQVPEAATPGAKIPIIFVATAGGASRAAYWTGVVLAKLETETGGRFGRHVFAISSVSGGTLGAAAYLAERAEGTDYSKLADKMKKVNGADHLAPTIAGMLFPDLLQRLLPLPLLPDRAEALERSFEASGKSQGLRPCRGKPVDSRFERPLLELWRCAAPGAWVPVLLANGTRAEDGRRIVTTNLRLPPGMLRDALDFHDLYGSDVPLSVAVTNSARFPIISPPGTLPPRLDGEASRGHIIDGGYFENGGISSLSELAAQVIGDLDVNAKTAGRLQPVFIEINNDDTGDPAARYRESLNIGAKKPAAPADAVAANPKAAASAVAASPKSNTAVATLVAVVPNPITAVADSPGLDALLPLLGLYNSRSARGTQEALRVKAQWPNVHDGVYRLFQLCPIWRGDQAFPTPMNWTLSRATQAGLDHALDDHAPDSGCGWAQEVRSVRDILCPAAATEPSSGPVDGSGQSCASTASPIALVPSVPPRSAVRAPVSSAASTAASTWVARSVRPSE